MDVLVLGGGASGLMAALEAARHGARVTLLEKEARVGKKLLATGNGRCNLYNTRVRPEAYHGGGAEMALACMARIPPDAVRARFVEMGLYVREEAEGRVYPITGQASSVLDALRFACDRSGVEMRCSCEVTRLRVSEGQFHATLATGETLHAPRLIAAMGGVASAQNMNGYTLMAALDHRITDIRPALVQLKVDPVAIRGLKGVRADVALTLYDAGMALRTEEGEILFTEYGVSGVAAMQCARQVGEAHARHHRVDLAVDLLPGWEARDVDPMMRARFETFAAAPMELFFTGLLHKRIGLCLLQNLQLSLTQTVASVGAKERTRLSALLRDWRLPIAGTQSIQQAQVTAGGLCADEWDARTLESKRVPGLFATGELLDVDGDCGGYNLLWAWVSGMIAGEAAAK